MPIRKSKKNSLLLDPHFIMGVIIVAGLLRYMWIFTAHPWATVQEYLDLYVYSDMLQYWINAQKYWTPDSVWHYGDLFYPPGNGALLAFILGPQPIRLGLFLAIQWFQSMWIFFGTGLLAFLLYGKRVGVIALSIAAIAFCLFDYSVYFLAETPFTSLLLAAVICMVTAFKQKQYRFFLPAGILFGLGATVKAIGLIAGLLLLPLFFLSYWKQTLRMRIAYAALFCAGLLIIIIPTSFIMTERNHGEFMLLSNDIMRIALVNHGNLRGTTVLLPDEGWEYVVQSPSTIQKDFHEMRNIDLEKDNIVAQNISWVLKHPFQAFTDYIERTFDFVYGTLPFPSYYTPYRSVVFLSQFLMMFLVYLPAAAWALQIRKRSSRKEYLPLLILLLPIVSLPLVAIISVTETRYLHPFAPFLIVLASAWYSQKFEAH